jgi:benzoyl-CoA-dihydrodiol lyase
MKRDWGAWMTTVKTDAAERITFGRQPAGYRHWSFTVEADVATVVLAVDPTGGLREDYELKLNSYDLTVDIELADLAQRLRFEHPEVRAVVVTSGADKVFCAGANIQMLAGATHDHKVNFCKFTNETRNGLEDATETSQQVWLCALNGVAAGGGYELALACDEIILVDDRSSTVSLPEVPLLGVLPGTGGLTRLVDKRHVRRDLADVFATRAEGVRGAQALSWGLVDSLAPRSTFVDHVADRAAARAATSDRPGGPGVVLDPLACAVDPGGLTYGNVTVTLDRVMAAAAITVRAPLGPAPATIGDLHAAGSSGWALQTCRELDDAILQLRFNEPEIGTWVLRTEGSVAAVLASDHLLASAPEDWLIREIRAYWKRTLKRLDVSARSLVALIEPGSCFAGTLAELALVADRSFMLEGLFEDDGRPEATVVLSAANDGNGLSRLSSRFWGRPGEADAVRARLDQSLDAAACAGLGLVTFTPDDIDWDDEIRLTLEERAAFSPDAMSGLEANLRFVGPETTETKIFSRLSAWQNWIFLRANASGPRRALRRYVTGSRPSYDRKRV